MGSVTFDLGSSESTVSTAEADGIRTALRSLNDPSGNADTVGLRIRRALQGSGPPGAIEDGPSRVSIQPGGQKRVLLRVLGELSEESESIRRLWQLVSDDVALEPTHYRVVRSAKTVNPGISKKNPLRVGGVFPAGGKNVPIISITPVSGQDVDAVIELQGD